MSKNTDNQNVEEIECLEAIDSLYAYLDGELTDEDTLAKFKHHLSHCNSCHTRSEMEGAISKRLKTAGKEKSPASLKNRLHDLMSNL